MSKDITPRNKKRQPHGYWKGYYGSGNLWYKCFYTNSEEIGYEEYCDNFDNAVVGKFV